MNNKSKLNLNINNKQLSKQASFECKKCGFESHENEKKFDTILCNICHNYAPDIEALFLKYIKEKIDGKILNTFRNSNESISKKTLTRMNVSFEKGNHIAKAPKGYKLVNKLLIPSENSKEIEEIFQEFLNTEISLTQLGKKYSMSTAGIKKLLQNKTYIGKVKFGDKNLDGQHKSLLSKQLFEQVQDKLKSKGFIKE